MYSDFGIGNYTPLFFPIFSRIRCAPGYTRSQTAGGRECEPIGEHLPAKVKFVPEPDGEGGGGGGVRDVAVVRPAPGARRRAGGGPQVRRLGRRRYRVHSHRFFTN